MEWKHVTKCSAVNLVTKWTSCTELPADDLNLLFYLRLSAPMLPSFTTTIRTSNLISELCKKYTLTLLTCFHLKICIYMSYICGTVYGESRQIPLAASKSHSARVQSLFQKDTNEKWVHLCSFPPHTSSLPLFFASCYISVVIRVLHQIVTETEYLVIFLWKKHIFNFSLHNFCFNYIYMVHDKCKHLYIVQDQSFHWTWQILFV